MSSLLIDFLNSKPLYYDDIDYDRMPRVWAKISNLITLPKVIHIVGTNGKGSSGRFLAHYLYKSQFSVLHYSSPHILEFNERIWIDGSNVKYSILDDAHSKLLEILDSEIDKLSYFEYTTILALFLAKDVDYLVLEAGLGGEFDATNVVKSDISLITPISFDHESFLGNSIEEIASTKLRSVDNIAIISTQKYNTVIDVAKKLKLNFTTIDSILNNKELDLINSFIESKKLATYLFLNLSLAMSAIKYLKIDIDLNRLNDVTLFGRCYKLAPNITIDVGHNPLASEALLNEFRGKKICLIYNTLKDKDYNLVLKILKPIIEKVLILDIENSRVESKNILENSLDSLNIPFDNFNKSIDLINSNKNYLVFGSFFVVEEFLKNHYKSIDKL